MTNNNLKQSDHEVFIPLNGLMNNLHIFSLDMINKNEIDMAFCKRIEAATNTLKEYFSSTKIEFLHELNMSSVLVNLRLFLRVFAPDEIEMMCVQLIDKLLRIGLELNCIDQIAATYWSRVSPAQWFRDNTPIY